MRVSSISFFIAVILLLSFSACEEDCKDDKFGNLEVTIGDDPCGNTYDIFINGTIRASMPAGRTHTIEDVSSGITVVQIKVATAIVASKSIIVGGNCNTSYVDFGVLCDGESDQRYKKNIVPFSGKMDDFMRIGSYVYEYRTNEFAGLPEGIHTGFMAQELLEIYPHLVKTNKEGYYSVNYMEMIPILTRILQDQQLQINHMQQELDALKSSSKHTASLP